MVTKRRPYHHGDLGPALIKAAVETIDEVGPAAMSLREVARRAGVTHPAATYHFGDKAGLLTAVAIEGYRLLGESLRDTYEATNSLLDVGVAYVRFAVTHRPYFEVMYGPAYYDQGDVALLEAKAGAAAVLYGPGSPDIQQLSEGVAAWAILHGIATLWLNGNLPPQLGQDPEQITRMVAAYLQTRQSDRSDHAD
jgi:AcrR family transcriptional regulator